jgi:hypothetical protein
VDETDPQGVGVEGTWLRPGEVHTTSAPATTTTTTTSSDGRWRPQQQQRSSDSSSAPLSQQMPPTIDPKHMFSSATLYQSYSVFLF